MIKIPLRSEGKEKTGLHRERKCLPKDTCLDLRKIYGNRLFPVCPALQKILAKCLRDKPSSKIQETKSLPLNAIKRVLALFDHLTQLQPTEETIILCAHFKGFLGGLIKPILQGVDDLPQLQQDVQDLPQLLETDFPDTSKRLAGLGGEFVASVFRYCMNHQAIVYLMPPDNVLKYKQQVLFEDWRHKQIDRAKLGANMAASAEDRIEKSLKAIEMRQLTCTYPAEIIKVAANIRHELQVPLKDLSQRVAKPESEVGPAEKEQKAKPSKRQKFVTCLKKIVEKGWQIFTKSFWEALFERLWH